MLFYNRRIGTYDMHGTYCGGNGVSDGIAIVVVALLRPRLIGTM